jgi:uncharacterized membrane protein YbhN (UPF0104 family)
MSPVRHVRRALPYVVCAAALIWVALSTPMGEVGRAFEHVSWWRVLAIAVPFILALLVADAFALWVGLRVSLRVKPPFKDVVLVRGASYLLALVNYSAGQGGIVWFLHRRDGVPLARATGAVLLTTGAFLLAVVGAVAAGLALEAVPEARSLHWLLWLVAIGLPIYLAIIVVRPRWLARYALLQPLFDAGVLGTLAATASRVVHLAVLIVAHAMVYRLFGIALPVRAALVLLPIIFLVQAMPIAPAGLGTTQAAAVALLAPYVAGPDGAGVVVAASIGFQAVITALMAVVGMVCLRLEEGPAEGPAEAPPEAPPEAGPRAPEAPPPAAGPAADPRESAG